MPIWNYTRCTGITGSHRVRLRLHFCLTCLTRDTERNAGTRYRDKSESNGQPYLSIFFFFFTEVPWATTERTYQISTFNFFLSVISVTFFEPSCSLFISYFLLFSFYFLNLYFLFFLSFLFFPSSLYFLSLLLLSASVPFFSFSPSFPIYIFLFPSNTESTKNIGEHISFPSFILHFHSINFL